MNMEAKVMLSRLLMLIAIALGAIGLAAGFADRTWKLESTGWLTGGILVAVLSIVVLADYYVESRNKRAS